MSRLLVNSIATVGKLMRNVDAGHLCSERLSDLTLVRNYSALNTMKRYLEKNEETRIRKLMNIDDFQVAKIDEKYVDLVKEKYNGDTIKIKFHVNSHFQNVASALKDGTFDEDCYYFFASVANGIGIEELKYKNNFIVEIDKGKDANFVAMCHVPKYPDDFEFNIKYADVVSKEDTNQVMNISLEKTTGDHITKVLEEDGITANFVKNMYTLLERIFDVKPGKNYTESKLHQFFK